MAMDAAAARYIDTTTAARLMDIGIRRVHEMIERGDLSTIEETGQRGRGGRAYYLDINTLPLEAQLRYLVETDGHGMTNAELCSYRDRFGQAGLVELWKRHEAVMGYKALESDGKKNLTRRKAELAVKYGKTERTLYRWYKAYQTEGLAGLMDKIEQCNKGEVRCMCMMAQDYVRGQLMVFSKRTNRAVLAELSQLDQELGKRACSRCVHCEDSLMRREFALAGIAQDYDICDRAGNGMILPQSKTSFNKFCDSIPDQQLALARFGKRYWEARYMPKCERMRPTKINECWFGDHHMFDCFVIDDDGAIVRPWMTAWSDAASGAFVGWGISTNPNSSTIAETFVRAIVVKPGSPFSGVPGAVYIDNGKDYRSKRFEGEHEVACEIGNLNAQLMQTGLLRALSVQVIHAQPYKAWSKTIERLFGTLESRYIRELPGWCGGRPDQRPENLTRATLEKMAERGQLLTLRQFEEVMREQVIPAYHAERFGKSQSPLEIYTSGEKLRDDTPSWEVLDIIRTEAVTRKVSYMGIKLHNQLYWHDEMRHMCGQEVTVRYSRDDVEAGVSIMHNGRFICHANVKEKLRMINEDPEKLAKHLALQRLAYRETKDAIDKARTAASAFTRNVIYEHIDPTLVGCKGITTTEYRRAAKAKQAAQEEQRGGSDEDKLIRDQVLDMFKELGRAEIAKNV